MPPPDVTIVLPTQGRRSSLVRAWRSALAQRGATFEVVVVDDAPPGERWLDAAEFRELARDPRVRLVTFQQARGCAAAKNAGLRAAHGEWVCYLDDDNRYHPDKVAAQLALAQSSSSPVVLCGLDIVVGVRRRRRQVEFAEFRGDDRLLRALADTNVLFHRRDAGVAWPEDLRAADDVCFFHELISRHGVAVVPNVPAALVEYHAHPGPRVNVAAAALRAGQRRLLVRWAKSFSPRARRVLLLRSILAFEKQRAGRWGRFAGLARRLVREGGPGELRFIANAAGVKLPIIRRWLVT